MTTVEGKLTKRQLYVHIHTITEGVILECLLSVKLSLVDVRYLVLTGRCLTFSGETAALISLSGITLEVSGCLSWSLAQELLSLT